MIITLFKRYNAKYTERIVNRNRRISSEGNISWARLVTRKSSTAGKIAVYEKLMIEEKVEPSILRIV